MNKQQEPRLRFRDFMGAWEDRMLGKVADVRDGTHDSPIYQNQGIPLVTSKNLTENGLDFSNVSLISQEDYEEINKRSKVESGDILLGLIGTIGKPVLVKSGGYAIKNVGLIKELLEVKNEFLLPLLQSNIFETYVSRKNTGNTQKFLALDGLRSFEFLAPSLPEQTHLGNFFRRLDSQIAESRAVLEKSRQLKKAMLAKMFPANGEKIPKIRFKGFEGEWESRKLGDVVEIVMGQSPSSTSYTDNPSDFILVQGNADMKNGKVCPRVWTTECIKLGAAGDIVMSVRAPVGDVGKTDYDIVVGRGVCAIKGNEFIYQTLWKMKLDGYWSSLSSGSTFEAINSNDVKNSEILIPIQEEQTAIGNFFRQLDETIALQSAEVEKLNQLKKGLLAAMLV
ncbi:restriction endonuclease subunit S [Eikenella corrodens]|uniref:restriction endonuclease subunit S n=1 Tax=Eikenella corrodens TaxID=539 RepID=UPI00129AAA63|nr:restriction endonuclease subunit S [Eikenella corrodens]